jgi:hypothetical protein
MGKAHAELPIVRKRTQMLASANACDISSCPTAMSINLQVGKKRPSCISPTKMNK